MTNDLQRKVILITGCARGIGYSTALNLAKHGYIVCATVKTLKNAQAILAEADQIPNLYVYELNVTDDQSITSCIQTILADHEQIDILVSNAAKIIFGPIETVSVEQFKDQFDVNLFGSIRLLHQVLPKMRERNSGHIIFIGSTSGVKCSAMYGAYSASKFAMEAIAYSLAVNLYPWNVRVSIIEASATSTQIADGSLEIGSRLKETNAAYDNYVENSLDFLKKILINGQNPEEVADIIRKTIEENSLCLRVFPNDRAKGIFSSELMDPFASQWRKDAIEEHLEFSSDSLSKTYE